MISTTKEFADFLTAYASDREEEDESAFLVESLRGAARLMMTLRRSRPLATHCKAGHEYVEGSFSVDIRNARVCKACSCRRHNESKKRGRDRDRVIREKNREAIFSMSVSKELSQ